MQVRERVPELCCVFLCGCASQDNNDAPRLDTVPAFAMAENLPLSSLVYDAVTFDQDVADTSAWGAPAVVCTRAPIVAPS